MVQRSRPLRFSGRPETVFFLRLLALCIGLALCGAAVAEVQAGTEKPLVVQAQMFRFQDDGKAPSYTLRLGDLPAPAVVLFFISGSGCASVKHRLGDYFQPISRSLNALVLALQKRGIDENNRTGTRCAPPFHETDYLERTIADQREFIDAQLGAISFVPSAVVLLGASEGAVVAARIAASDRQVTHLGLVGGGGIPVRENLRLLARTTWYLRHPESTFAAIAADPANTDEKVWGHSYKYWSSLLDVNIGDDLIKLDIPIVAAMGEKDDAVPIEAARLLQRRFRNAGKSNLLLLVFPNANHRLEDRDNGKSYAKDFLANLVNTIEGTTSRRTGEVPPSVAESPTRTPQDGDADGQ